MTDGTALKRPTGEPWSSSAAEGYWAIVREIVGVRLHDVAGVSDHGLGPLAADILETRRLPIDSALARQQRLARVAAVTAPLLLERIRAACDGPMLVLKGPEIAALYPRQARAYGDIDLLVPDAAATQLALLEAGFVEVRDPDHRWVGIQHLNPLVLAGAPLAVEVHSVPKWPEGLDPPPFAELLERAGPSISGVSGVLAPAAPHQVLLLAAHAWAHQPLGKARDLVDVGAARLGSDDAEISRLASSWDVLRIWHTMSGALDAFLERRRTWPLRLWASHVPGLRGQTVLESHLERLVAPFWGMPAAGATRQLGHTLLAEVRPAFDEDWPEKLERTMAALRRPFVPVRRHRRLLGDSARRGQRRNAPDGPAE